MTESVPRELLEQVGVALVCLVLGAVATVLLFPGPARWIFGAVKRGDHRLERDLRAAGDIDRRG